MRLWRLWRRALWALALLNAWWVGVGLVYGTSDGWRQLLPVSNAASALLCVWQLLKWRKESRVIARKRLYWTLDADHQTVPVPDDDVLTWARWFETADNRIAEDFLEDDVRVSTVFLGMDHSYGDHDQPVLFETMIFGGPCNNKYQERWCTYAEALEGHAAALAVARDPTAFLKESDDD